MLRWGLVPSWARDAGGGFKMINARAETLLERAAYRRPFEHFRCLIPADGFYEWQTVAGRQRKQPFHITRCDGAVFAFAGLWSVWHRGEPEELRELHDHHHRRRRPRIAEVHDRMPVILPAEAEGAWLAHDSADRPICRTLLVGVAPEELALRPVGPAVSDARNDGPECLLDPPPPAQDTLFAT